jgi:hypothetical protein
MQRICKACKHELFCYQFNSPRILVQNPVFKAYVNSFRILPFPHTFLKRGIHNFCTKSLASAIFVVLTLHIQRCVKQQSNVERLTFKRSKSVRGSNFFIGIVGGGVQLDPLDTAATNRPIVPAPGDYDGEIGGMIGRGNRSTWRTPAPGPLCPPQTPHAA